MSYLLRSIMYFSVCVMILGISPGSEQTVDCIMGAVSTIAYSVIEFSASVTGKSHKEIIGLGFEMNAYVRVILFCIFGLWAGLMIWLFSYRSEKMETGKSTFLQRAERFK